MNKTIRTLKDFAKANLMVVLSLVLIGCGGGGADNSSGSGTTQSSPPAYIPPRLYQPITPSTPTPITSGTGYGGSLSPSDLITHYGYPTTINGTTLGAGQTIVVIDGPGSIQHIQSDLSSFNSYYGLPTCTFGANLSQTSCNVKVVDLSNGTPSSSGYSEIALDVQWAHAMAPGANIVLIIAADNYMDSVMSALQVAVQQPGVVAVSMSFGSTEFSDQTGSTYDGFFRTYPGIAFLAAAGDSGGGIGGQNYPAASPYVTAVGGTTVTALSTPTNANVSEEGWIDGGGGSSSYESMPSYQRSYMLATGSNAVLAANQSMRAVPDVAYNADPSASPVAVMINGHWNLFGGTSAATPQWAAIVAGLAQSITPTSFASALTGQGGFNSILYQLARTHPTSFYNVATGQNGLCGVLCQASSGYNDVTGLGVPMVTNFYGNFLSYAH